MEQQGELDDASGERWSYEKCQTKYRGDRKVASCLSLLLNMRAKKSLGQLEDQCNVTSIKSRNMYGALKEFSLKILCENPLWDPRKPRALSKNMWYSESQRDLWCHLARVPDSNSAEYSVLEWRWKMF